MTTVLVTGASRGIGHELAVQLLARGDTVFATYRNPAGHGQLLKSTTNYPGTLTALQLDVRSPMDVREITNRLLNVPIDVLINNAGIMGPDDQNVHAMDYDGWTEVLETNLLSPFRLSTALIPSLRLSANPRIMTLSSIMGSLSRRSSGYYAYRSSKAAVNKVMRLLSEDLSDEGIIVCPVHPGWVQTEMGGHGAEISASDSAAGLIKLMDSLTIEHSGRFWQWDGTELPW